MEDPRLVNLEALTVVELRSMLKKMGLKTSGRKAELIERIKEAEPLRKSENRRPSVQKLEQSQMPILPPDMLVAIALELELPDLFRFCMSSKRHNEVVCKNKMFWLRRLQRDKMGRKEHPNYKTISDYKSYYRARRREYKHFLNEKAIEFAENGDLLKFAKAVNLGAKLDYDGGAGTALEIAVGRGHENIVKHIIQNGLVRQFQKDNALKDAVTLRNNTIAKYLINNGADLFYDDGIIIEIIYENLDKEMINFVEKEISKREKKLLR